MIVGVLLYVLMDSVVLAPFWLLMGWKSAG
jgi:hypothetical protein